MTNLSSPFRRSHGFARQFALALALASGTALLTAPGLTDAAHAQKRDKKKKGEAEAPPKPVYSKEFVAAYQAIEAAMKVEGADPAAIKAQLNAVLPLAVSADEQQALGGLYSNVGLKTADKALQFQGAEMIIASGKLPEADRGRSNMIAFQLASDLEQYDKARSYLQRAIDLGFTTETISVANLQLNMAELYFIEDRNVEGLQYLADAIAARKAQGLPVDERWYRRGLSVAYNNEIVPQVYDFVAGWVSANPAVENWRDAINITRNLNDFEPPVMLDLLRLGKQVGTLTEKNDIILYIDAADARRLPQEVKGVIDQAYASGIIPKGSDTFVDEQRAIAAGRIAADRGELPALERDANSSAATYRTVVAAGDAFLSYGEYAKAAGFYEKALDLPGIDRDLVLTRLGIARAMTQNYAAATQNFDQVSGIRAPIAMLWAAYAAQQAGASPAVETAPAAEPVAAVTSL